QLAGLVGIEHDQRVQIAVPGVEDIGAAEGILALHGGDGGEHFPQVLAGNGAIHAVVIRGDAADGGKGRLAPRPVQQPLRLAGGDLQGTGAAVIQHGANAGNLLVHLLGGAVGFHQQNGGGAEVVAGLDEGLHRGGGGPVHHLEAGGNDARGDDG